MKWGVGSDRGCVTGNRPTSDPYVSIRVTYTGGPIQQQFEALPVVTEGPPLSAVTGPLCNNICKNDEIA